MLKKCFVLVGILLVAFGCSKNDIDLPKKSDVKEIMTLVCDYELKNTHLADNWQRFILNSWVPSSFYPGLMAQYRVSEDEKYLTMAKLWGEAVCSTLLNILVDTSDYGNTLLCIQAQGIGIEPYVKDISEWSELREIPTMSVYFENMDLISLSFRENLRCKRYPWKDAKGEWYPAHVHQAVYLQ